MVLPLLCLTKFAHVKPIADICMMLRDYTDSGPLWIQKILESCSFVISMCKSKFMLTISIVWFLYYLANFMPSLTLIYGLTEADFMKIIHQKRYRVSDDNFPCKYDGFKDCVTLTALQSSLLIALHRFEAYLYSYINTVIHIIS